MERLALKTRCDWCTVLARVELWSSDLQFIPLLVEKLNIDIIPSLYGATAPSGPWLPSRGTSILLCLQLRPIRGVFEVVSTLTFYGMRLSVSRQNPNLENQGHLGHRL